MAPLSTAALPLGCWTSFLRQKQGFLCVTWSCTHPAPTSLSFIPLPQLAPATPGPPNEPNGHLTRDWTQFNPTARKPEPTCLKHPPLHIRAIEMIQAATSVHHPAPTPPSSVPLNYVMSQMSSHTADCSAQPLDITGDNASNRASVLGG